MHETIGDMALAVPSGARSVTIPCSHAVRVKCTTCVHLFERMAMSAPPLPPAMVLADDEPTVRLILLRMLAAVAPGYELVAVGTGHDALAAVAVRPVALLITDYNMPGMNGVELAQHVKATAPATTIVLLTAYVMAELEQRSKAAGVDYFLAKPFSFDQLVAIVRKALG
jgi:CheY-like chemotaxis protein